MKTTSENILVVLCIATLLCFGYFTYKHRQERAEWNEHRCLASSDTGWFKMTYGWVMRDY